MLGVFDNFPTNVHRITLFSSTTPMKKLQQVLVNIFHKLNSTSLRLEDVSIPSIPECKIIFEFGIADAQDFTFLDGEETAKLLEKTNEKSFQTMDFLCVLRYHRTRGEKRTSLKLDHYFLRFTFGRGLVEIQVYHEKGAMHVSPEEIIDFISEKINQNFSKRVLRSVPV